MSDTYETAIQAISQNPELQAKLAVATSPKERHDTLVEAGIVIPSKEEMEARSNLADVSGGSTLSNFENVMNDAIGFAGMF